jgi:hypothetical protein
VPPPKRPVSRRAQIRRELDATACTAAIEVAQRHTEPGWRELAAKLMGLWAVSVARQRALEQREA